MPEGTPKHQPQPKLPTEALRAPSPKGSLFEERDLEETLPPPILLEDKVQILFTLQKNPKVGSRGLLRRVGEPAEQRVVARRVKETADMTGVENNSTSPPYIISPTVMESSTCLTRPSFNARIIAAEHGGNRPVPLRRPTARVARQQPPPKPLQPDWAQLRVILPLGSALVGQRTTGDTAKWRSRLRGARGAGDVSRASEGEPCATPCKPRRRSQTRAPVVRSNCRCVVPTAYAA